MSPLILAAALAASQPSDAAPAAPAPAAAQKARDDPDRVVCRTEPMQGSRITARVCRRKADWDRIEQARDRFVQGLDDRTGLAPSSNSAMGSMGMGR